MNGYEKIVSMMRKAGSKDNPESVQIAYMTEEKECETENGLELDEEDLIIAEHVGTLKAGDEVALIRISEESYLIFAKVVE